MSFELWQLFLAAVAYLLLLFFIAYAAERGWLPQRLARHPLTYSLSLGVYATSWSYYGSVGFAQAQGFNFLTIYLGVTLSFLLAPVLLQPILRLTREYQLASLADLFAFRYQSQLAGVLVTLFMLAGILPYLALQVRAVTESVQVLTHEKTPQPFLALAFCLTLILFAVLFGARHSSAREKHEGLVVAIAFESLVKLAALLAVGLFVLFGVFEGFGGLGLWLDAHPKALDALYRPVREGPWPTLLLLAFAAAFLLPRQFHMTFTENIEPRTLSIAAWGFPLFLLLLNLSIPPILWAGEHLRLGVSPDYYVLGVTLTGSSGLLPVLTFLGGVSAASAMMIVETLALASMCMNHLVLPASFPPRLSSETDIYRWLLWGRRLLIAVIILAGYAFYLLLEHNQGLVQLGLISFVAVAQFLPGVAGLLFWRRATRDGFIAGLLAGGFVWWVLLVLPLLERSGMLPGLLQGLAALGHGEGEPWSRATFVSLAVNGILFAVVSLLTRPSEAEREAARACCRDILTLPAGVPLAESPAQFKEQLTQVIGAEMAEREVGQALSDLGLSHQEQRLGELSQLRERIERNLSGLMGPLLARMIVNERLLMDSSTRSAVAASLRFVEQRLEESRSQLRGQAAELDNLRRYHRQVLLDLPLGVCAVGPDLEVISWNQAMTALSGLEDYETFGRHLKELPEPWSGLLRGFLRTKDRHMHKVKVNSEGRTRMFNLHKASVESYAGFPGEGAGPTPTSDTVILIEDLTDLHLLESELTHSERLASLGRLAAGVAHEIGNPITGIACLAQNVLSERDDPGFVRESAEQILEQTRRVSNIVHSLVSFSHGGSTEDRSPEPFDLRRCVEDAVRLMRLSHAGKQIEFLNLCDEGLTLQGNAQRMGQVFVNLISNACDASRPGQQVTIEARRDGDLIEASVTDQGRGIPEELQERVFEPFFTTKQPGEGTGLGLPMVYNIVGEHGGTLSLRSQPGLGTRVILRLPARVRNKGKPA
ncbi:MAG: histidine kinase [Gammaproteobacteria bacterium RIFOXYD12_FULL_61_37]|nr:MAG: histidine kinase [Gammaproteobacteria bacterium RIFOXYD12_FULL_61_37]